jgi:hypothetical protein
MCNGVPVRVASTRRWRRFAWVVNFTGVVIVVVREAEAVTQIERKPEEERAA